MADSVIATDGPGGLETVLVDGLPALRLSAAAGTGAVFADMGASANIGVATGFLSFEETVVDVPPGTGIRYLFSTDDRHTWQRWAGAAWVSVADPLLGTWDEANTAAELTPDAMAALNLSGGRLRLRVWMKTDTPGVVPVLRQVRLSALAFLPVDAMARPVREPHDLAEVTVISPADTGREERWEKRSTHRRRWRLSWEGLTVAERQGLLAFCAAKRNHGTFLWREPDDGDEALVRLDGWRVNPHGQSAHYDAEAVLVEVS